MLNSNKGFTFACIIGYNIQIQMRIKKHILKKIDDDDQLKGRLARTLTKSIFTIQRYINRNSPQLRISESLKVIREELGLTDDQILEETKNKVA